MQRNGYGVQKGLIFVLNNLGDCWNGCGVYTRWNNTKFVAYAWWGKNDNNIPQDVNTDDQGSAEFWAPPRGYVVYIPQ